MPFHPVVVNEAIAKERRDEEALFFSEGELSNPFFESHFEPSDQERQRKLITSPQITDKAVVFECEFPDLNISPAFALEDPETARLGEFLNCNSTYTVMATTFVTPHYMKDTYNRWVRSYYSGEAHSFWGMAKPDPIASKRLFWISPAKPFSLTPQEAYEVRRNPLAMSLERLWTLAESTSFEDSEAQSAFVAAHRDATLFISNISLALPEPILGISGDGEIVIEWRNKDLDAVISFEGDEHYGYALLQDGRFAAGKHTGNPLNDIPSDLKAYLEPLSVL